MRQFVRLACMRAEFTAPSLTAPKTWEGVHSAQQRKALRASPYEAPSRQGDPDRIGHDCAQQRVAGLRDPAHPAQSTDGGADWREDPAVAGVGEATGVVARRGVPFASSSATRGPVDDEALAVFAQLDDEPGTVARRARLTALDHGQVRDAGFAHSPKFTSQKVTREMNSKPNGVPPVGTCQASRMLAGLKSAINCRA